MAQVIIFDKENETANIVEYSSEVVVDELINETENSCTPLLKVGDVGIVIDREEVPELIAALQKSLN